MELPVIGGRGAATAEALVRAVRKGSLELARTIAGQEESIDGAVAMTSSIGRAIADANSARDVHIPAGQSPQGVLAEVTACFSRHDAECKLLVPTEMKLDDAWLPLLETEGFSAHRQALLLMGADAEPALPSPAIQVVSARAVVSNYHQFVEECCSASGLSSDAARETADCETSFLDVDALDVLVARHEGRMVASIGALTVAELGILRAPRFAPDAPPSCAAAILWHLLDLCKRSQFRQVVASVSVTNLEMIDFFKQMGMKQVATTEYYVRAGYEVCA